MSARPRFHRTAESLADAILSEVGPDIVLALPLGLGKANHIANALYARAAADHGLKLTILTALTLEKPRGRSELESRFIDPVIDRLFGDYPELDYARAVRGGTLPSNIKVSEFFLMAGRWLDVDYAQQNFIPANYTHAGRYVLDRGVNVIAQLVARNAGHGERYSLSCNSDVTLDFLRERAAGNANCLLVGQVNSELPYMPGEAEVDANEFAHILDTTETDFPLFAPPKPPVDLSDYAAGLHIARLISDGGTLQVGIGSIGDAVAQALILRHRHNAAFRELLARLGPPTKLDHTAPFAKGLYGVSEMLVDGFLPLAREGVLKREVDRAIVHAAFFLGPKSFYRELREMPEDQRSRFRMTSVSYVNQLYGDEAEKVRARHEARFVNNAMIVTLLGDVVSDALENGEVVSGVGGQYNFVSQAFALPDARAIITLPSVRRHRGKVVSNIRWSYGNTTIPHHLRDIIVTEHGIADLRGTTHAEAIVAMIGVADSRFQPQLLQQAKSAGKIVRDYQLAEERRRNSPERIAEALEPARRSGLLPRFPFGTDFTETEQRLMPALRELREAQHSYRQMWRMLVTGARHKASQEQAACLERMRLSAPKELKEFVYRTLLKGALALTEGGAAVVRRKGTGKTP
jgi:acyl-CoA hydrolase